MYKEGIPLVICDLETAGLDVDHAIIQVAAIAVSTKTWEELGKFETKIKFDPTKADKKALEINNFSEERWENAISLQAALSGVSLFFRAYRCAERTSQAGKQYTVAIAGGYNSSFDATRIFHHSRKHGIFQPVDPRFLDVMQLAFWKKLNLASYKLTELAKFLGVEAESAHDALADVRITIAVLRKLLEETSSGRSNP